MCTFSLEFNTMCYPGWTEKDLDSSAVISTLPLSSRYELQKKKCSFCYRSVFSNTLPAFLQFGSLSTQRAFPLALHVYGHAPPVAQFLTNITNF